MMLVVFAAWRAWGAEIHSNGRGGGPWSEPLTWHGGKTPGSEDIAVIAMRDTVTLGRNDTSDASCRSLYIDPEGVLSLKPGERRLEFTVQGPIESYGVIKIDATESPLGMALLRLAGASDAQRVIRLFPHSAFLVYGRKDTDVSPENSASYMADLREVGRSGIRKNSVHAGIVTNSAPHTFSWLRAARSAMSDSSENARIVAGAGDDEERQGHESATISAAGGVMFDLCGAHLADVIVEASAIDNTGNKADERLNIVGNRFHGLARLALANCDTPVTRDNQFTSDGVEINMPAVSVVGCKLAEIHGNRVIGGYAGGIHVAGGLDPSVAGNSVLDCAKGIYLSGNNAMIRNNAISNCAVGLELDEAENGVVEHTTTWKAATAFRLLKSTAQFTSCRALDLPENGGAMHLNAASVILLNCDFSDDLIKLGAQAPSSYWAQNMQYLTVKVSGERPLRAQVIVRTAAVSGGTPAGKADLNARNSPAPLSADGLTPLPNGAQPLIVRSWRIGADGKKADAPFYEVVVSAADPSGGTPKELKTVLAQPADAWFRPYSDAREPTLEISLP